MYKAIWDGTYLVTFDVRKVHGFGDVLGNGALSTSCWTRDQPDVAMLGLRLAAVIRGAVQHLVGGCGRERKTV